MAVKYKNSIIACLLIWLSVAGWWVYSHYYKKAEAPAGTRIVTITKGAVDETVTSQGKLEPKVYVDVGAQVSGQLKKIYVDIGYDVKKGDLLAEIDPRIYQSRVDADQARLKTLGAQLAEQEAQQMLAAQKYKRNQRLVASKAISQEGLEESAAENKAAEARVASIKAEIEESTSTLNGDMASLSYTKIYAPQDGTIVQLPAREGQTLNANQTAPNILQIANLDTMTVRAQVAEADIMRLTAGMPAYFTTLGRMEKRWKGTVRQILPSPELINDVVLYNVLIDVDNQERQLMNGMSTQIFFELGGATNVPLIPVEALMGRVPDKDNAAGSAYRVRVLEEGGRRERIIHIGHMNRSVAEIKDGLQEGDRVIIATRAPKGGGKKDAPYGMQSGPRL